MLTTAGLGNYYIAGVDAQKYHHLKADLFLYRTYRAGYGLIFHILSQAVLSRKSSCVCKEMGAFGFAKGIFLIRTLNIILL